MAEICIEPLTPVLTPEAVQVLARAFVTNPIHVAAFGEGALERNEAMFRMALAQRAGTKRVAVDGERILGYTQWIAWPHCQVPAMAKLRIAPAMIRGLGLGPSVRVIQWLSAWSKLDPKEPHAHLGPIGVDPGAQGRGVGRRLMDDYCQAIDRDGLAGYLETDRPGNVDFYQRFGFELTREDTVLGVRNFFMRRSPRPLHAP